MADEITERVSTVVAVSIISDYAVRAAERGVVARIVSADACRCVPPTAVSDPRVEKALDTLGKLMDEELADRAQLIDSGRARRCLVCQGNGEVTYCELLDADGHAFTGVEMCHPRELLQRYTQRACEQCNGTGLEELS